MTRLLDEAIRAVKALPVAEQEAIAALILTGIGMRYGEDAAAGAKSAASPSRRQFGSARGLIHMADDFDAPLEGFTQE